MRRASAAALVHILAIVAVQSMEGTEDLMGASEETTLTLAEENISTVSEENMMMVDQIAEEFRKPSGLSFEALKSCIRGIIGPHCIRGEPGTKSGFVITRM